MATLISSTGTISNEEADKVNLVMTLFETAKSRQAKRRELWKRSYRIVHNRAWGASRDPQQPTPTASEIYPILASLVGWMTDQRTRWEIVPSIDPHSEQAEFMQGLAHDLELLLDSIWVNHYCDAEVEKMLWDSMIYGTGFGKCTWDAAADDGAGNAVLRRIDPFNMYIDPAATSFDTANYIIEARRMSWDELVRRFPAKAGRVIDRLDGGENIDERDDPFSEAGKVPMSNPGGITKADGTFGQSGAVTGKGIYGLPGQNSKRLSAHDRIDGSVTVYECWVKENTLYQPALEDEEPYYVPEWRVVVVAAGTVLFDEKAQDLWNHGGHPYVRYVQHDLGDFWGISLVDHLAPGQLAVNRLLAAMQHHAELCGNPIMLEDARSGIPRTQIVNRPGQRLTKNTGSEVAWLVPPDMPQGVPNLVTFWINEMERISGLSAIVRGATPTGRNAQGVLDSVQESAFVRVRLALRNLERTISQAGQLIANLIVENYTLPRTVAIAGRDGERTMLALKARHFLAPNSLGADPMKFALYVQAGASMPISRSARAQEADTLFAMGALDQQAVLEAHDYPNRRQILERLNAMMGMGVQPNTQIQPRQR